MMRLRSSGPGNRLTARPAIGRLILALLLTLTGPAAGAADLPWQQPYSAVAELAYREPDQTIPYGEDSDQRIELWLPAGADPAPVVVLIHGGCWLAQYDIAHIRPLAAALSDAGFAVWAPEYRRVGQAGGGWPGTFEDIGTALDLLRDHPGRRLDRSRVVYAGHSAGGHLALWAAGRARLQPGQDLYRNRPHTPRGVVGLAAITDLRAYAEGDNSCQRVTPQLLGPGAAELPGRLAQASPAELGADVPLVLLHGDADGIVPLSQSEALPAQRVLLPGAGHFDLIHPQSAAFPRLLELLRQLLAESSS